MIVTLTKGESEVCRMVAQMRNRQNTGINHDKVSDKPQEENNYLGVVGEYAFCKAMNVCPDLSTEPRKNGYDCLFNEHRVDIKATNIPSGSLLLPEWKDNPDIDIYVLAILHPFQVDRSTSFCLIGMKVELVGWAFKTDLMQPENLKDLGKGLSYMLTQQQLRKFKQDLQHA
jgi:hypothetical protein